MSTVPINLLLLQLVHPESKTYSMALSIAIIHLIGDIPSPILIGKIWDWTENATVSMEISTIGLIASIVMFIPICLLSFLKDRHKEEQSSLALLDNNYVESELHADLISEEDPGS